MQSEHTPLGFSMIRIILLFLVILAPPTFAQKINYQDCNQTNNLISNLYKDLFSLPPKDISTRIIFFGKQFIGKQYELGALGEGDQGYFDQYPLYRTDAFDCETYVDTVLALAFARNISTFQDYIKKIRYNDAHVSFIERNHFTCLDWNQNNQKQGFVKDITSTILDENHRSPAMIARAYIDKPSWYQHFSQENIRLREPTIAEQQKRLVLLKQKGQTLPKQYSEILYIPFTALFDSSGNANQQLLKQIPNGAIIEIVRPNWDLTKEIGTHLNISHLGFADWEQGTLYFLQASSLYQRVSKTPLIDYLRQARTSPTIKGINIQVVLDPNFPNSKTQRIKGSALN